MITMMIMMMIIVKDQVGFVLLTTSLDDHDHDYADHDYADHDDHDDQDDDDYANHD